MLHHGVLTLNLSQDHHHQFSETVCLMHWIQWHASYSQSRQDEDCTNVSNTCANLSVAIWPSCAQHVEHMGTQYHMAAAEG